MFTSGLVCSEDSLSGSDDPQGDVAELLLLLGTEEGEGVRHLDSAEEEEDEMEHIATSYQVIVLLSCQNTLNRMSAPSL